MKDIVNALIRRDLRRQFTQVNVLDVDAKRNVSQEPFLGDGRFKIIAVNFTVKQRYVNV